MPIKYWLPQETPGRNLTKISMSSLTLGLGSTADPMQRQSHTLSLSCWELVNPSLKLSVTTAWLYYYVKVSMFPFEKNDWQLKWQSWAKMLLINALCSEFTKTPLYNVIYIQILLLQRKDTQVSQLGTICQWMMDKIYFGCRGTQLFLCKFNSFYSS